MQIAEERPQRGARQEHGLAAGTYHDQRDRRADAVAQQEGRLTTNPVRDQTGRHRRHRGGDEPDHQPETHEPDIEANDQQVQVE